MKEKRVVGYIFYSINDIEKIEKHRKSIINYAVSHLEVKEENIVFYIDIGSREDRAALDSMMKRIKSRAFDVLLVDHISHLYKAISEETLLVLKEMTKEILNSGVEIISILEKKHLEARQETQ